MYDVGAHVHERARKSPKSHQTLAQLSLAKHSFRADFFFAVHRGPICGGAVIQLAVLYI